MKALATSLQGLWLQRSPQERKMLAVVAAVLLLGLYLWLLHASTQASATLRANLPALRMQLLVVEQQAAELERLRLLPAPARPDTALLPLVELAAANAGLAGLLTSIEARNANQIDTVIGAIPFPAWLAWTSTLRLQGITVEKVSIETLSTQGQVSVTATLVRAGPP